MSSQSNINLKKASYIEAADELTNIMPPVIMYEKVLHVFNGKFYEYLDDDIISQQIVNMYVANSAADVVTPSKISGVMTLFKYLPNIKIVKEVDNYPHHICFNNGILDLTTHTLLPHSPEFFFTASSLVDFDPSQTIHPTFDKFLSTVFTDENLSPDKDTIENIIQLGGYLLYPENKMEKMFILYGDGSNGKSILIDYVFKPFFPPEFFSSLSLNLMSDERSFERNPLLYSRINFATEQKASDLESDELKKIITGEHITIPVKHRPKPINHRPRCKILISANKFMRFKDTTEGLRRRLMIFNFQNRFETSRKKLSLIKNPKKFRILPAGNKDDLVNGLKKELPAILNTFLAGLKRLQENKWELIESENSLSVYKEYLNESDYLGTWITETIEVDEEEKEWMSVKDAVNLYKDWWEYNFADKKFDVSTKLMGKRLSTLFRIKGKPMMISVNGKMSSTTSYPIKIIKDELWEQIHNTTQSPNNDPTQLSF